MIRPRTLFLLVLVLGAAATVSFHASGALDERDALTAAAVSGAVTTSPPGPVTARVLGLGTGLVRLVWAETGLFRALHLVAGALLSVAAGLGALVALRMGGSTPAGFGAALFVAMATLFGGDLGRLGLSGSPVPVLLVLLAGAAAAWTGSAPAAFAGGLLLGAAVADHPFVLFLLPGFVALGRSGAGPGFLPRAGLGFAIGSLALFLPVWDSAGRLDVLGALGAWGGGDGGAFWSFGGPRRWSGGALELVLAFARNAGPGALLCAAGAGMTARGRGDVRAGALLLTAAVPAAAIVLGQPADPETSLALATWPFLLLVIPITGRLSDRLEARAPALGFAAGLLVLALSWTSIDRSAEKGIVWSRKAFDTSPRGSLLLTGDPVHRALAADGERPDLDVVYIHDPSTLAARSPDRIVHAPPLRPGQRIDGRFLHEVVGLNHALRDVLVDPRIFFDLEMRADLLGDRWVPVPHGLAYRLVTNEEPLLEQDAVEWKELWVDIDLAQKTPPSPLREGKTAGQYYARSLLQAASLYIDLELEQSAERDFMMLLSLDEANHSLAALGFARLLHVRQSFDQAIRTLQDFARETDEGAWLAYQLLGNTCLLEKRWEEAIAALETAIRLAPPEATGPRQSMQRRLENARARLAD